MVAVLAPRSPEQVLLSGQELMLSPLIDRQHIALDQWAQSEMIDAARRSVPDGDEKLWDRVVGLAMRESMSVTWYKSGVMRTRAGYARLVWESLRTAQPKLALAEVIDLIAGASEPEVRKLNETFMRLNYRNYESNGGSEGKEVPQVPG